MFLRCLPREIRILLAHEDLRDLKLLAAKADILHTHHKRGTVNMFSSAANAEDSAEVYPKVLSLGALAARAMATDAARPRAAGRTRRQTRGARGVPGTGGHLPRPQPPDRLWKHQAFASPIGDSVSRPVRASNWAVVSVREMVRLGANKCCCRQPPVTSLR